jgi:hypothetical protein
MPREFATAMMVHVSMQPKLMSILQVPLRSNQPVITKLQTGLQLSTALVFLLLRSGGMQ